MTQTQLAPSVLSADLGDLTVAVRLASTGGADVLHVDVMDGHFVPNLSFGLPVIAALRRRTELPLDVHLMVANPDELLSEYIAAGASWVSVHWEACRHLHRTLTRIRELGASPGLALNPTTPVEVVRDCVSCLDFILVMSVNPGFSGQSFIPESIDRVARLHALLDEWGEGKRVRIEIDGGIGPDNIRSVVEAGADICVSGSEVYGQDDPVAALHNLRARADG